MIIFRKRFITTFFRFLLPGRLHLQKQWSFLFHPHSRYGPGHLFFYQIPSPYFLPCFPFFSKSPFYQEVLSPLQTGIRSAACDIALLHKKYAAGPLLWSLPHRTCAVLLPDPALKPPYDEVLCLHLYPGYILLKFQTFTAVHGHQTDTFFLPLLRQTAPLAALCTHPYG